MMLKHVVLVGALSGVAGVGGCTTVRNLQPEALSADNAPAVVWVRDSGNAVFPLSNPVIRKDTLRGTLNGGRVKIPMNTIRTLQARMPDHARTALLALTLGVGVVSTIYVAGISQAGGPASNGTNCGQTVHGDPILAC